VHECGDISQGCERYDQPPKVISLPWGGSLSKIFPLISALEDITIRRTFDMAVRMMDPMRG
jgi:hypothetical protein